MTRIMYDSITPEVIPADAEMVAGYVNGRWDWAAKPGAFARWPHAAHVRIDVNGSDPLNAGVIDVERGDASPEVAARWVTIRNRAGLGATVYCNRATLPSVREACHGLKYKLWIATLDGSKLDGEFAAVQYLGAKDVGFNADMSIVYDDTWHPAPRPARKPVLMHGTVTWDEGKQHRDVQSTDNGKTWR